MGQEWLLLQKLTPTQNCVVLLTFTAELWEISQLDTPCSACICGHFCERFSAVHQGTAGEHDSEGEAAGDGGAAQPEQSGAGEAATSLAGLLLPLTLLSLFVS